VKQRASAFSSLKNAESLASAKINLLVSLTNGSFGLAVINDQLMMVEGVFLYCASYPPTYDSFSAYYVREEWRKGHKTLMDINNDFHRCNILPRSALLSVHSTTAISSIGMRGDKDHTVHTSPLIRVPLHCATGDDSSILVKSFLRAHAGAFRIDTSRLE
jgi:hypothetical protein